MFNSVRPHRRQPTRLPCTWGSPGKNTGVGCHFLLQCMKVKSEREVARRVRLLATLWTAAYQAPPSMGFSRQEYWSGVPSFVITNSKFYFIWWSCESFMAVTTHIETSIFTLFIVYLLCFATYTVGVP